MLGVEVGPRSASADQQPVDAAPADAFTAAEEALLAARFEALLARLTDAAAD